MQIAEQTLRNLHNPKVEINLEISRVLNAIAACPSEFRELVRLSVGIHFPFLFSFNDELTTYQEDLKDAANRDANKCKRASHKEPKKIGRPPTVLVQFSIRATSIASNEDEVAVSGLLYPSRIILGPNLDLQRDAVLMTVWTVCCGCY